MIRPSKYTDYNMSILNIAATVLKILLINKKMKYNLLLQDVQDIIGEDSKYDFQNALNFLFLLGKINYFTEEDVLELII